MRYYGNSLCHRSRYRSVIALAAMLKNLKWNSWSETEYILEISAYCLSESCRVIVPFLVEIWKSVVRLQLVGFEAGQGPEHAIYTLFWLTGDEEAEIHF